MSGCEKQNLHALIVEDNPTTQLLLQRLVESRGFQATIASNGAEGLYHYLRKPTFDIVLLDLMMPEVTGEYFLKVAESLYQRKIICGTPKIIVCTAVTALVELWQLTSHECIHAIIEKPVSSAILFKEIDRIMSSPKYQISEPLPF